MYITSYRSKFIWGTKELETIVYLNIYILDKILFH